MCWPHAGLTSRMTVARLACNRAMWLIELRPHGPESFGTSTSLPPLCVRIVTQPNNMAGLRWRAEQPNCLYGRCLSVCPAADPTPRPAQEAPGRAIFLVACWHRLSRCLGLLLDHLDGPCRLPSNPPTTSIEYFSIKNLAKWSAAGASHTNVVEARHHETIKLL